jgi:hypothetical protein
MQLTSQPVGDEPAQNQPPSDATRTVGMGQSSATQQDQRQWTASSGSAHPLGRPGDGVQQQWIATGTASVPRPGPSPPQIVMQDQQWTDFWRDEAAAPRVSEPTSTRTQEWAPPVPATNEQSVYLHSLYHRQLHACHHSTGTPWSGLASGSSLTQPTSCAYSNRRRT